MIDYDGYDSERDHDEEAAVRADYEAEYRAEYEEQQRTDRITRVRQRLTLRVGPWGVRPYVDGTPHRILIEAPRRKRDLPPLVALLEQAADLGAAHGRCDQRAELTALLHERDIPGCALYEHGPDGSITMHINGTATTLPIPEGLRPSYVISQTVQALRDIFLQAGTLADEPEADTPPPPATKPAPPTGYNDADLTRRPGPTPPADLPHQQARAERDATYHESPAEEPNGGTPASTEAGRRPLSG